MSALHQIDGRGCDWFGCRVGTLSWLSAVDDRRGGCENERRGGQLAEWRQTAAAAVGERHINSPQHWLKDERMRTHTRASLCSALRVRPVVRLRRPQIELASGPMESAGPVVGRAD
jgi:hypothetical protein